MTNKYIYFSAPNGGISLVYLLKQLSIPYRYFNTEKESLMHDGLVIFPNTPNKVNVEFDDHYYSSRHPKFRYRVPNNPNAIALLFSLGVVDIWDNP